MTAILRPGSFATEQNLDLDPILLIEKGYQHYPDASCWLHAVTESVAPAIDPGYLAAMSYVIGPRGPEPPMSILGGRATPPEIEEMVAHGWTNGGAEPFRILTAAGRKPGIQTMRQELGDGHVDRWLETRASWPIAMVDSLGVWLPASKGKSVLLSVACSKEQQLQKVQQAIWHRIAIHLSAGYRLAGRAASSEADDVDAVLTADGCLAHARGESATSHSRKLLRRAAQDMDRARSRQGRADPLAALELWQGLLAGKWSLVDHFDTDGKRFLLARRNEANIPPNSGLTRRQRQVVFYASLGMSTKETAYAIGVAENTISAHLSAGLAKLGMKSRAQLIRTSGELALEALTDLARR